MKLLRVILEIGIAVLLTYTVVFCAVQALPADPARSFLGPMATESAIRDFNKQYGWDQPLWAAYIRTLTEMVQGNFGHSFYYRKPAAQVIRETAPGTFGRAALGVGFGVILGITLGYYWSIKNKRWAESFFTFFYSIPSFCILVLLLWGASTINQTPLKSPALFHWLTVLAASLYPLGTIANHIRAKLDFRSSQPPHIDFLFMLHASRKEVSTIIVGESIVESVVLAINTIPVVLSSVAFGEIIFSLPGFGQAFIEASMRGDLSVVVSGSIILSIIFLIIQKIGDRLTAYLDTRTQLYD